MSAKEKLNFCPLDEDYELCKDRALKTEERIAEMHAALTENVNQTKRVADTLERLEGTLVSAATGRKQVPIGIALMMIGILGAALIVAMLAQSSKTVEVGLSGFAVKGGVENTSPLK